MFQAVVDVLNKTPGLLFTTLLLAFVIGTMVDSILDTKRVVVVPVVPVVPVVAK